MQPHNLRLRRAICSLQGLSVGDAFGERFFLNWDLIAKLTASGAVVGPPYDFVDEAAIRQIISRREVPSSPPWRYTDDTQMALSVVEVLRRRGEIKQDVLAESFGRHYDNSRGYGAAMHSLLPLLAHGAPWQSAAQSLFGGTGSFGNGAAMRVAPVGAYFADDLDAVVAQAKLSCEVTHAHPEAIAGGVAVAVATACAARLRPDEMPCLPEFIDSVLPFIPPGQVREGVARARDLSHRSAVEEAVDLLGNGSDVTAQDTVPFVLWCAAQHLHDYEEALWLTVSGLGDRDTTCAMVGGIVALSAEENSIPTAWSDSREPLPDWPMQDL